MNCETCKYWDVNGYKAPVGYGSCQGAPGMTFTCHMSEDDIVKQWPEKGAVIEYDEEWGLVTGPKFGCVLWEEKR